MKTYLCLITVRKGEVPRLRHVDSPHDDEISASLVPVLAEWVGVHRVEVMDGDRLAFVSDTPA